MNGNLNLVSENAEVAVSFRMCGVSEPEMRKWMGIIVGIPCEWHRQKGTDEYVFICDLDEVVKTQKLQDVLTTEKLPDEHGLYVSLVSDRDNDGVRLASFISEFYRKVGGTIDFSYVSV